MRNKVPNSYAHTEILELKSGFRQTQYIQTRANQMVSPTESIRIVNVSIQLAKRIGIDLSYSGNSDRLPYQDGSLLYNAPILSSALGREICFLRGWKEFDSCIKGFNALGLMAEVIDREIMHLKKLSAQKLFEVKVEYLKTRKVNDQNIFSQSQLAALPTGSLGHLSIFDVALWSAFAEKPIVCSTSSNMGITLHQILRLVQKSTAEFGGEKYFLLNVDEGRLIIWCPDERADFMSAEKAAILRQIAFEKPKLTELHTYLNRQQRDPNALRNALELGGYFFPTNPQSAEEMQNFFFITLGKMAEEKNLTLPELIHTPEISEAIEILGYKIEDGAIIIANSLVSGMQGLMIPYFCLFEEMLANEGLRPVSIWNQVSIGAAIAAAVMADEMLRNPSIVEESVRAEFELHFANIAKYLKENKFSFDLQTRIHGVFDVANLQSLAQLLGVVVEKHKAGTGTAYVGLGSSSYSNGNKCYDVLRHNFENGGAFRGKNSFHPATHTLNSVAQGIIWGEDFLRCLNQKSVSVGKLTDAKLEEIAAFVKKPEPAGAAALAGYLLANLDQKSISVVEVAMLLRKYGFNDELFLEFSNRKSADHNSYILAGRDEGPSMGSFAEDLLTLLNLKTARLLELTKIESVQSRKNAHTFSLDDVKFDSINGSVCIYLTGDNCQQPALNFYKKIILELQKL